MRQACPEAHPVHWGSQREEAAQQAHAADRLPRRQWGIVFRHRVWLAVKRCGRDCRPRVIR